MLKTFRKLLMAGEEKLFTMLARHVGLSRKSMSVVIEMLKGEVDEYGVNALVIEVITNEKSGDKIAMELTNLVSKGAIPLALLGDIEVLIDRVDDILDLIYFMASEYERAHRVGVTKDEAVKKIYMELVKTSLLAAKALEALQEEFSVALNDFEKLQSLDDKIDVYEDRVDDFKSKMLDKVYSLGKNVDAITFNHLIEMIRSMDTIVDACEDASHLLLRVVSSMMY